MLTSAARIGFPKLSAAFAVHHKTIAQARLDGCKSIDALRIAGLWSLRFGPRKEAAEMLCCRMKFVIE